MDGYPASDIDNAIVALEMACAKLKDDPILEELNRALEGLYAARRRAVLADPLERQFALSR